MTTVILFVFGTIVGSFLNVVGLRWDRKNFGGRSHCPVCQKTLHWWELIPILSFFLLRQHCSGCKAKISPQYPLIEFWCGLLFVTVPTLMLPVFCLYVIITIYDYRHQIIPDPLVYAAITLSLIVRGLSFSSPLDWIAGPIIFASFASIWLFSRGRAMGFGDAKLGLSIGWLLGAWQGFSAIMLSFWLGTIWVLGYLLVQKIGFLKSGKELTMKSEVPFAPMMIIGAWLAIMFHLDLLHVSFF